MLRSNLCDYADSYIPVKGIIKITVAGDNDAARRTDERDKDEKHLKIVLHLLNA